jgi:hypothetical protein
MTTLTIYYLICVFYCFFRLYKSYQKKYNDGMIGISPGLDALMVVIMAWILAPIDVSLTWIRLVKEAEESRRRQEKFDLGKDLLNEEDQHGIY